MFRICSDGHNQICNDLINVGLELVGPFCLKIHLWSLPLPLSLPSGYFPCILNTPHPPPVGPVAVRANPGRNGSQVKWRLRPSQSRPSDHQSRRTRGSSRATPTTPPWWARLRISAGNIQHWWRGNLATPEYLLTDPSLELESALLTSRINILTGITSYIVYLLPSLFWLV